MRIEVYEVVFLALVHFHLAIKWKRDLIVADTGHYDFSDYPIVFETSGFAFLVPKLGVV